MCNVTEYKKKLEELETYLEFVNTEVDRAMAYEPELYAAYWTLHPQLGVEYIGSWYKVAEELFISAHSLDVYLGKKYDVWSDESLDYYYEKEVNDDLARECGGYWFKNYRD